MSNVHGYHLLVLSHGLEESSSGRRGPPTVSQRRETRLCRSESSRRGQDPTGSFDVAPGSHNRGPAPHHPVGNHVQPELAPRPSNLNTWIERRADRT